MSGEKQPRDPRVTARVVQAAAELLYKGEVDLGDTSGLTPDEVVRRLQNAAEAGVDAEIIVDNAAQDGN